MYVLRFDNTFSWTRAKTLSYIVEVLPPDDSHVGGREVDVEEGEDDKTDVPVSHTSEVSDAVAASAAASAAAAAASSPNSSPTRRVAEV